MMIKTAEKKISKSEELEQDFWRFVELANEMPPQTADNMLIAYAYYKQATEGDVNVERPTENSSVIRTFKFDSWKQLEGMTKSQAKRKYIETITQMLVEGNH